MFDKEIYIKRREVLKSKFDSGLLVFLGNNDSPMNYLDNYYDFRQDSTFRYYFGINRPGLNAIIDLDKDKTILFGEDYDVIEFVWMGKQETLAELGAQVGVSELKSSKEFFNYSIDSSKAHYLPPYRDQHNLTLLQFLDKDIRYDLTSNISLPFIKAVIAQRNYKSDEEIMEMQDATNITCDMHEMAMKSARAGMSEHEITALVQGASMNTGGNISFPIILSMDSQILHNHVHNNILTEGRMLLVDSGAQNKMGYAGDMTRTFPVSSKFSQKQKDIYSIVLKSQHTAINSLKPGISYFDVHQSVGRVIVDGLKELGIMKGTTDDAVEKAAYALFMPHGLGHMIGMDVHDMENLGEEYVGYNEEYVKRDVFGLRSLRLGKKLEARNVITVEPGVYFIPELINIWEKEKKFSEYINYSKLSQYLNFGGIRIEDDYLITDMGSKLLGREVAKEIEDVEQVRYNSLNG